MKLQRAQASHRRSHARVAASQPATRGNRHVPLSCCWQSDTKSADAQYPGRHWRESGRLLWGGGEGTGLAASSSGGPVQIEVRSFGRAAYSAFAPGYAARGPRAGGEEAHAWWRMRRTGPAACASAWK